MPIMNGKGIRAALLFAACCYLTPAVAEPLPCDDGIKTAFRPDANTSVIAVRLVKKGEELKAPDASQPITAAADLCLVKLLVGPGATADITISVDNYSSDDEARTMVAAFAKPNWYESSASITAGRRMEARSSRVRTGATGHGWGFPGGTPGQA